MSETDPPPDTGSWDEKDRIRKIVSNRGLSGAANDVKWGKLLDAMRLRQGWKPCFRYKCVDGEPTTWDHEWWHHLPFPMMSVHWLDMGYLETQSRGALIEPEVVDHSDWVVKILNDARFDYDVVGDVIRVHGYLPKCMSDFDMNYS